MGTFRKPVAFLALALALAAGLTLYHFWGERYQIVLTEQQLKAKLDQKFPIEKTYFFLVCSSSL